MDMREYKRSLINIRFDDNPGLKFFVQHSRDLTPLTFFKTSAVCFKGKTADLYYDSQNQVLYKFFWAKKKKIFFIYFAIKRLWEIVKNMLGLYPAKKEFSGNRSLHHAGLNVAESLGMGFVISPVAHYRCLLVLSYIPNTSTLKMLLDAGRISSYQNEIIRNKIIGDICSMAEHKIRFRDFTVNNILIDSENTVFWIDTRTEKYYFKSTYRRAKKRMLKRFTRSFSQAKNAPQELIEDFIQPIRNLME